MSPLFQPLRDRLYAADELLAGFSQSRPESYAETADFQIYRQYVAAGAYSPTDYFMALMEVVHDNSIRQATQEWLKKVSARAAIAFMGGHDLPRDSAAYATIALLSRELARRGYLPISGGGPGAMEATHLGALHQKTSLSALTRSLKQLARHPDLPANLQKILSPSGAIDRRLVRQAHAWMLPADRIRRRIENPGESLAIPTWVYGHEPTTLFATRIAKYFQNSVREDRLLSIATHGVIYFEGRAGTVQEIFQDAAQNSYRVLGDFSPMIFFGARQWSETLPVVAILKKLFTPNEFETYVCVTSNPSEVVDFLARHKKSETPAERLHRRCQAEGLPSPGAPTRRSRQQPKAIQYPGITRRGAPART